MSTPPANLPRLPEVLAQLKDVKTEATELRNFTITFLSTLLYVNLIIAGTNAEQILRIAPVTLPLLNVQLPIIGFYGFLPWLLLLFHLYLLVQHYLFSQLLYRFDDTLRDRTATTEEQHRYALENLGNLPFLHWMIGRHGVAMRCILTLITLICLLVWPLVTLLWLQMAIMPYHSQDLMDWQRAAIVLDVLLIGWLWPKTLARDDSSVLWWWHGVQSVWDFLMFLPRCVLRFVQYLYARRSVGLAWLRLDLSNRRLQAAGLVLAVVLGLACVFRPEDGLSILTVLVLALSFALQSIPAVQSLAMHWLARCWLRISRLLPRPKLTLISFAVVWVSFAAFTLPDTWGLLLTALALAVLGLLLRVPLFTAWLRTQGLRFWRTLKYPLYTSTLAFSLFCVLFMSFAVATLPDSCEERFIINLINGVNQKEKHSNWFVAVADALPKAWEIRCQIDSPEDVNSPEAKIKPEDTFWLQKVDVDSYGSTTRMAFMPTAILHEQHAKDFKDDLLQYDDERAKGAKPCPSLEKPSETDKDKDKKTEALCLMVQPLIPRNMLLRDKVLTADTALKPELEAQLQASAYDGLDTKVAVSASTAPQEIESKQSNRRAILMQIRGLDLQNRNFDYADFSNSSLPKANLRYVSMRHAVLVHTRLDQAQMDAAHLEYINQLNSILPKAELPKAKLTSANLESAQLPGANLSEAQLPSTNLHYAQLPGANLHIAQLPGAHLSGAHLPNADLSGAQLPGADLAGSHLPNADLSEAQLSGANMSYVHLPNADLSDAQLHGANLSDAQLPNANLPRSQLYGTNLNYANLSSTNLFSAQLPGADLNSAQLSGATLDNANFEGALLLPNISTLSDNNIAKYADNYSQALSLMPDYQGAQNQQKLEDKVKHFKALLKQSPDFSNAKLLPSCLRNDDKKSQAMLKACSSINKVDEKTQQALSDIWIALACDDNTEGHWVAQRMVERAEIDFDWFAQPLLKVAQDPKTCPGLAYLTEKDKADLQDLIPKPASKPGKK